MFPVKDQRFSAAIGVIICVFCFVVMGYVIFVPDIDMFPSNDDVEEEVETTQEVATAELLALTVEEPEPVEEEPVVVDSDQKVLVVGYDPETDYYALMTSCAADGSEYAMIVGEIYEQQRNLKIDDMNYDFDKTSYFSTYSTGEEILSAMNPVVEEEVIVEEEETYYPSDHQTAYIVYDYFKDLGYSDTTIAGLLGNMMLECGGNTLDLNWNLYSNSGKYYGLCMWSSTYYPNLSGTSLSYQLDYLADSIGTVMSGFGGSLSDFKNITDAGSAAKYFCTYYERGSGISTRVNNAYTALSWIQSF